MEAVEAEKTLPSAAGEAGFTLVELLVVMVIMVLLASLVAPRSDRLPRKLAHEGGQDPDRGTSLRPHSGSSSSIQAATPMTAKGLTALVEIPAGNEELERPLSGTEPGAAGSMGTGSYHYRQPGRGGPFDIYTLGADNREGGQGEDQDVASWALERRRPSLAISRTKR